MFVIYSIKKGANVTVQNRHGETPLLTEWSLNGCQLLITNGADINHANKDGPTFLIISSIRSHFKVYQLFLGSGADFNIKDQNGNNALLISSENLISKAGDY
jgi:ankyrin repeat protein